MMFKWQKLGIVFGPSAKWDRPWLKEFAQAPSTIVFDNVVRVYFSCRPGPDKQGQYVSRTAWVDLDRFDLTRVVAVADSPVMDLGELGTFDEFGIYPFSAIKNGEEVIAFYGGWTRCQSVPFNVGIGFAKSDDQGRSFYRTGKGPILPYTPEEPFVLSGPKIRRFHGRWQLFYIAGTKWIISEGNPEPVYRIRSASSDDLINWTRSSHDLIPFRIEENEAQASPDVFFSHGRYHMFFCYRYSEGYRGKDFGYRIGYATSKDLIKWERNDCKAGLDVSESGWDSEMVSYPHILQLDGQVYMFYLGNQVGKRGFGLARLLNPDEALVDV